MKKSKTATFITTGNNQLLKCHIVANKLLLFLAIIVVIVHGHGFVFAATTVAAEEDSNLPAATPPLSIEDDGIELRKEAFLKWFLQNGGIFHPIQVVGIGKSDDGDVVSATATVNVTLEQFPSFGGWGLALPLPTPPTASVDVDVGQVECLSDDDDDNTITGQCTYTTTPTTPIIQRLDPLFTVPSSLILSVDSILDIYTIESSPFYLPSFYTNVNAILIRSNPPYSNNPHHGTIGLSRLGGGTMMGLVEQDVVIAMHLMVEECHHQLYSNTHHQNPYNVTEDSYWGEYLDVLPQYTIPRLDTFGNEEYAALQDDNLEFVGRNSKRLLERMFLMNQYENDDSDINADAAMKQKKRNGISLQGVVREMIHRKLDIPTMTASLPESSATALLDSCTSFEAFHRFVGIVASRAMVLNGRKYLTPLADMINYSPYVEPASESADTSRHWINAPFTLFHTLSESNSITVRSDRDIFLPATGATSIQLFEDYGPVDSSLFLEAHGFVPFENPNNCAIILGTNFLRRYAAVGRLDENVALVLRAFKLLHFIHPKDETKLEALNDMCVKANLEIVDDGEVVGRKPASDALAITSLVLSESGNPDWMQIEKHFGQSFASLRGKCIAAIHSKDPLMVEVHCARYPGSGSIVKQALRTAARRIVASLEGKGDTMASLRLQLQQAESLGRDQLALALRFRLEERTILHRVANAEDDEVDALPNSVKHQCQDPENHDDLEKKLIAFSSFVETLELPVNKIEPRLVGNGMRLGAFATEDLEIGESYLSLSLNSVLDIDTALADVDEFPDLATLLLSYSNRQSSLQDGGFDALLLYLLHERFILKEQSRWWSYLDLLPSIDDVRNFHPLFFDQDDMDRYLSGSDVRQFIQRYQRLSSDRHKALSSDLAVNLVLGYDTIMDRNKVYWTIAILDSRSIWWNGKRHLVPLLDLVNADGIGIAHETRLEDSDTRIIAEKAAVTRASRHVKKGEQVFENYAQPNYLLFTYHGFILDDNPNDCALLDGLYIHRDDPGAKYAHRLPTIAPTFCIREKQSIDELAQFLRAKHDLSVDSDGVNDSMRPYVIQVLEERIVRLNETMHGMMVHDDEEHVLPRLQYMKQIVKNDLAHFQHALDNYILI